MGRLGTGLPGDLHGGCLAGLGLIFLYVVGEALSRREFLPGWYILLLAVAVTLVNPYGIDCWHCLYEAVTVPRPHATEWGPVLRLPCLVTSFTLRYGLLCRPGGRH